jgi:hypothetical protein
LIEFLLRQKGCYKQLKANLTEPSKINQIAVMIWRPFKLNKARGFDVLYFTLRQIVMMNFSGKGVFLFFGFAAIVTGCTNPDKINTHINYDQLYFDYTVTGGEDNENVTCVFQYKYGDEEGKAVNVEPAKTELAGQALEADSAKLSGFFYEVQKPIDSFADKHIIVFKTTDGKQYRNEFDFFPVALEGELPESIHRKPFTIQLKNFPPTERSVRLLLLDTAFESSGFNDLVPVVKGKVNIDQYILASVENGPVILEIYLEQEVPLKQRTNAGGKISITYALKKEFELKN